MRRSAGGTAYRSLLFLFHFSNVFAYVLTVTSQTRDTVDAVHTYFYVHPWSTQALQCPARLVRSTAPTCARPPAHARTHSHVLAMLHPDAAHTLLSRLVFKK